MRQLTAPRIVVAPGRTTIAHAQLTGKIDFPHWIGKAPVPATEILSCANGLLHLPTRKLLPHTRTVADIQAEGKE